MPTKYGIFVICHNDQWNGLSKIAQRSEQLTCNQFGNNGMGIELLLFFFKEHIHSGDAFT